MFVFFFSHRGGSRDVEDGECVGQAARAGGGGAPLHDRWGRDVHGSRGVHGHERRAPGVVRSLYAHGSATGTCSEQGTVAPVRADARSRAVEVVVVGAERGS